MVEKVAAVILELHQGGSGHANGTCCQHQAKATTSDREGEQENKSCQDKTPRCNALTILDILILKSRVAVLLQLYLQLFYSVCSIQPQAHLFLHM